MHELGILNEVLDMALKVAKQHDGTKVTKITLKIGLMSGIVPRFVQSYFDVLSKDTIAKDAKLIIEMDPAVFICCDCGAKTIYTEQAPHFECEACGSRTLRMISGYRFQIVNVGIV